MCNKWDLRFLEMAKEMYTEPNVSYKEITVNTND